jgi:3-oxoacyl-[acyl-carrier-protein] synthase II
MARRVAITGCGVMTPAGCELDELWSSLMRGVCTLKPIAGFAFPELGPLIGGEVAIPADDALPADVDADPYRGRCLALALGAAKRALAHASLPDDPTFRAGR